MSDLTFPMIWCAGQVTIVCAVSLMSVHAVLNRRPELASRMAAGAVAVVWLVTLLIPLQLPVSILPASLSLFCLSEQTLPDPGGRDAAVKNGLTDSSIGPPEQLRAAQDYYQFDPRQLIAGAMRLGHAPSERPSRSLLALLIVLGLGVAWSLVRLVWGVISLRALVRSSVPINDQDLIAVSQAIQKQMKFRGCLNIRESAEIDCAAVVGFFRSIIMLSPQWRDWNEDERRAVLAHEMAHLCRRDSLWRLVASGCLAIHFYHPFLRRLAGRLVLAQELAADQLAITVAGGRQCYLRSLSRLALRQDEDSHVRVLPLFTPVFSGHWIRRIEMLKAMDCRQRRSERRWPSVIMVTSIALFGLTTTAIRALAQSGDEQTTAGRSAAAITLETIPAPATAPTTVSAVNVIPTNTDNTWQSTLFRNQKTSASHPIFSNIGAFHLDVAALRRSRSFGMCVEAFTAMVLSEFDPPEHWNIHILDALDSVTADARLSLTSDPEKQKEKNSLHFGFSRVFATTNRDVAWRTLLTQEFPEIVDRTVDGQELLEGLFPALGPYAVQFMPISPRSIALGLPVKPDGTTDARAAVDAIRNGAMESKDAEPLGLSNEWNAVSGGVLSLVATIAEPQPPLIFDDMNESGRQQLKTLVEGIDMASVGIDVGQSDRLVEAKLRLRCKDDADSGAVLAAVRFLVQLAEKEAADDRQEPGLQEWHEALQSTRIELIAGARNVVECQFRVIVSEELLQMIRSESSLSAPRQAANPAPTSTQQ